MRKVIRIDSDGFFIEDVILQDNETLPSDCINVNCQEGLYKPKWNGTQWIEGLTEDEINTIKNVAQSPSLEARISAIEQALLGL